MASKPRWTFLGFDAGFMVKRCLFVMSSNALCHKPPSVNPNGTFFEDSYRLRTISLCSTNFVLCFRAYTKTYFSCARTHYFLPKNEFQSHFVSSFLLRLDEQWAGKTIALGTFPSAEADEKCARAKALTRAWRSTMRPKPTREWVMQELERLGVRVVSGRLGRKAGDEDDGPSKKNSSSKYRTRFSAFSERKP